MTKEQIAHDLTVAIVTKETSTPAEAVIKYFDLLPQVKAAYEAEARKRGLRSAMVPK